MGRVAERFAEVYQRSPVETDVASVAERVEGLEVLIVAGPAAAHLSGNGSPAPVR
jgi:hypothetical protein